MGSVVVFADHVQQDVVELIVDPHLEVVVVVHELFLASLHRLDDGVVQRVRHAALVKYGPVQCLGGLHRG